MKIKGNGSIRPVKNNDGSIVKHSWQLVLSLGYDPITGKRIQKTRRFKGTKTEAKRALESFRREIESGLRLDADTVTFGEYAEQWIESREALGRLAISTIKRDKLIVRHLNKYLYGVLLQDIDAPMVRGLYIKYVEDGIGQNTLSKIAVALKQILKQAVKDDILSKNPCDSVDAPKRKKSDVGQALDKKGVEKLICALDAYESQDYPLESAERQRATSNMAHVTAVRLMLFAGLRRGEALGLSWSDIDFDNASLTVSHSVDKVTRELKEPKTQTSKRQISLDAGTMSNLVRWKNMQRKYLNHLGIEQGRETPVLTNEAGVRMEANNLARWWRGFREDNGFDGLRLHDLRHTHATLLVSSGLNLKAVSSRMGHSSIGITMDLYAHAQREDDIKAASIMGEIIAPSGDMTAQGGITKDTNF